MTQPDPMNDLRPVQAVLDPAYPERLREVVEQLYLVLVAEEPAPPTPSRALRLAQIAFAQCERCGQVMGGLNFYWHKGVNWRLTPRNRAMCAEFRGSGDYLRLARKYNLSEQQVRNIVDAWQREEFERRQGGLFSAPSEGSKRRRKK